MRLNIRVVPRAKKEQLKQEAGRYKLWLTAPAIDGRANLALISFLADHFGIKKREIRIISGEKNRDKVVEISPNAACD